MAEAELMIGKKQAFESLAKNIVFTKDDDNMKAFLFSYHHFLHEDADLFQIWVNQFEMACNNEQQGNRKYNVERMFEFLKFWYQLHPEDFSKANINMLLHAMKDRRPDALNQFKLLFLKATSSPDTSSSSTSSPSSSFIAPSSASASQIANKQQRPEKEAKPGLQSVDKQEAKEGTKEDLADDEDDSACKVRLKRCSFATQLGKGTTSSAAGGDFLEVSSNLLAREITMLDFELFSRVKCGEFLHHVWHASQRQTLAPNITAYIARFNEMSYWVVTEILMTRRKEQMIVLRKFIRLAYCFLQLNNFNSLLTIMSALNNSTIRRLKDAWAALPEKEMTSFRSMEEMLSNQQNFSNYFQEFKKRPLPKLPYFALFLRDCTFIHDGNKPYNRHGMINFEYMTMLYQCLQAVRECQSQPYDLPRHKDTQTFLCNMHYIDDEDALYMLSLKAQPSLWTNDAIEDVIKDDEESSDSYSWSDSPAATSSTPLDGSMADAQEGTHEDLTSFDGYSDDEGSSDKGVKTRKQQQLSTLKNGTTDKKQMLAKKKKGPKKQRKKLVLDGEALAKEKMVVRCLKGLPPVMVPSLYRAEQTVDQYFANCVHSVANGTISIDMKTWNFPDSRIAEEANKDRLILVRATAISVDFFTSLRDNFGFFGIPKKQLQTASQRQQTQAMLTGFGFTASSSGGGEGAAAAASSSVTTGHDDSVFEDYTEEVTAKLLYDFGYVSGMGDCKASMKVTGASGLDAWSMGVIHFVYSGRSNSEVNQKDDGTNREINPNDMYSEGALTFCFESDSWIKSRQHPPKMNPDILRGNKKGGSSSSVTVNATSVCHNVCGFAAGWTSAAFGMEYSSVEVCCKAKGDSHCVFLVTRPQRLKSAIKEYYKRNGMPDRSDQVVQYKFMDTKEAFISSTKAILASDLSASAAAASITSPKVSTKKEGKEKDKNKKPIKFQVTGRKKLPGKLESKLDNAELISTTTKEDLALQEQVKANRTAAFSKLFSNFVCSPGKGKVALETSGGGEERCVFLRADTLSTTFYEVVSSLMAQRDEEDDHPSSTTEGEKKEDKEAVARSFATNFLYDFGKCFAISDFAFFTHATGQIVPSSMPTSKEEQFLQKVFNLPEILRHVGWGKLNILSSLSLLNYDPKNRFKHFFLRYTVKDSFEASVYVKDQWNKALQQFYDQRSQQDKDKSSTIKTLKQLRQQHVQSSPVCILNCGYINSFLEECIHSCSSEPKHDKGKEDGEESSAVQLGTVEVSCVACGHETCEFLVAPAELMFAHVMRYLKEKGREEEVGRLRGLEIVMRRFKDGRGYFSRLFRK
ncbi:hypothetical protein QOT17_003235 [Balamuthia mandrillaris]